MHLGLIADEQRLGLERHVPVVGEFDRLLRPRGPQELPAPSVSPAMTAAILDAYFGRWMTAVWAVELLRGTLGDGDVPRQRAETAIDHASP